MAERVAGRVAAEAWWSRRFLDVIEGLGLAEALRGGRRLVRTEAVLDLRRSGNLVVAMVRGPDDQTVKARLAVRTFAGTTWTRVEQALAARAGYAATLLAGSMPAEIDRVFAALGLSLFPTAVDDLAMDCTCDDWQRPCPHIAAACYQLAQSFDRDPFALLALRGRERDALLDGLRTHRPGPLPATQGAEPIEDPATALPAPAGPATPAALAAASLPTEIAAFWSPPASDVHPDQGIGPDQNIRPHQGDRPRLDDGRRPDEGPRAAVGDQRPGPAGSPDPLDLYGPLVVNPLGDLRVLLRPAYQAFAAPHR